MTIGSPVMTGCTHILKEGFFVRKIKKALALSLALAMGLSLTACGSKEEATTAATTEATTEAASEATTEAASEDTSEAGGSEATGFDVSGINDKAYPILSDRVIAYINGMEHRGQFVFSTHNVLHLNLKTYMKEQIYFITKSKYELTSELYSLADFPEVRYENTKIYEFYMKGILGGTAFE